MRAGLGLLLALALVTANATASTTASPPCPGVRFLVTPPLVAGDPLPFAAIVIDAAGEVTVVSGCPATPARVTRHRPTSTVRARWAACGTLRDVRLTAKVADATCTTLVGAFSAKGTKRRRFTATASVCGDSWLDTAAGEQCESAADCPVD